jgi:hypothetical protein
MIVPSCRSRHAPTHRVVRLVGWQSTAVAQNARAIGGDSSPGVSPGIRTQVGEAQLDFSIAIEEGGL